MHFTLKIHRELIVICDCNYNHMNVRRVTVVNWLPQFGEKLQHLNGNPQIPYMRPSEVIQHHIVQQNSSSGSCGYQARGSVARRLPILSGVELGMASPSPRLGLRCKTRLAVAKSLWQHASEAVDEEIICSINTTSSNLQPAHLMHVHSRSRIQCLPSLNKR